MARRHDWQKEDKPASDDEAPRVTREELAEKLVRIDGNVSEKWRDCRMGVCRRQRACSAAGVPCWDPAVVADELHDADPVVRGCARVMSSYRGTAQTTGRAGSPEVRRAPPLTRSSKHTLGLDPGAGTQVRK